MGCMNVYRRVPPESLQVDDSFIREETRRGRELIMQNSNHFKSHAVGSVWKKEHKEH